jgi:site-specific recombinase XerD
MPIKILTVEEINKLLSYTANAHKTAKQQKRCVRNYTMFVLMLETGLRVQEVSRLLISDLIINKVPVINLIVRQEIAKNHRERIIPISNNLNLALQDCYNQIWLSILTPDFTFAFTKDNHLLNLSIRQIQQLLAKYSLAAIGRKIHPHILRHTFATRIMRVASIRTVQMLLGHKSITSTQIYTHPNLDDLKRAINNTAPNPPLT